MKYIILILLTLQTSYAANKNDLIQYSESVDVFEILENMSHWWGHKNPSWKIPVKLSSSDLDLITQYTIIRKKYASKPQDYSYKGSIFEKAKRQPDFISTAFYNSRSVGEALGKIDKRLTKDEMKYLVKLLNTLKPKISEMVRESAQFASKRKSINKGFKKDKGHNVFRKLLKFFQLKDNKKNAFRAYFVWWPKDARPEIEVVGNKVLLRYNPIRHFNSVTSNDILSGFVKAFIRSMSLSWQESLSGRFGKECKFKQFFRAPLTHLVFEESLSLALGAMMRESESLKKNFKINKKWSSNSWSNSYAKQLYPIITHYLKLRKNISDSFVEDAGRSCQEQVDTFNYLKSLQRRELKSH